MSTFGGRRGPNVSQYLRDLNAISPHDTTGEEGFNVEDSQDLALFTNTEFFDFDSGQNQDFQAQPVKVDIEGARNAHQVPAKDVNPPASAMGEMSNLDFMNNDFNFPEFTTAAYPASSMSGFTDAPQNFPPLQPNHAVYGNQIPPQQQAAYAQDATRVGEKRKADAAGVTPRQTNMEDASRVAAEEDKRRRNTAASARFRFKKKQREQALEKSAKEMTEKVNSLESKVSQLETENKWLKNLLVEKNEGGEDIVALWKEFTKQAVSKGKAIGSPDSVKDER